MRKDFVTFYSPGTFVPETTTEPIKSWDVGMAIKRSKEIIAKPYGFRFSTRERGKNELDSRETKTSGMYYLGGRIKTAEQVLAGKDPKEDTLRFNVRVNGIKRVLINCNSYRATLPLEDDDVVLEAKA